MMKKSGRSQFGILRMKYAFFLLSESPRIANYHSISCPIVLVLTLL